MPPKKDKSLEEPSKASKGSKAAPKAAKTTKATKAPKAQKAPKTPAPAPPAQAPAAARPLNPDRDVTRRTRANPSPSLSDRKAIEKEPSFAKKRTTVARTAARNAAAARDQDAEESTRTETPSASRSPELEESRSTSPELAPQPSSASRMPGSSTTDSSSHQAAESSKKPTRGTKRTRTQVDDSSDADTEDAGRQRRVKRPRGDDQPFDYYSPATASNSNHQVSDITVQTTPQTVTFEHTEATPRTPARNEENVGEQRPAASLSVLNNNTSTYYTPQATQAEVIPEAVPMHREPKVGAGEQPLAMAATPSVQGTAEAGASSSKSAAESSSIPGYMTAPRTLTMGPDHEHEAMMESLRRRQKQRSLERRILSRKTKPVEVERLHISDASDSEDLEPLSADGMRTIKENAKYTLANLAAEKQGKPKPYVWGPNPALEQKKSRKRSDAHPAARNRKRQAHPTAFIAIHVQTQNGPEFIDVKSGANEFLLKAYQWYTEHPNDLSPEDLPSVLNLALEPALAPASAVPSTSNNQAMIDQSSAGSSAQSQSMSVADSAPRFPDDKDMTSEEDAAPGEDPALESQTPSASQHAGWSIMSTVKSVVSKPFEFFGGASQHAGPSNADNNRSGSSSNTPNTPTPAGRFRRGDPSKRRSVLRKGKGKAPAVPMSKLNEFEEHSQNSRSKQRESVFASTADDDLPHHTQSSPVDQKPQRVRRRDREYYERKYAVPPTDPVTGNYVGARTFYAVPYPPDSDEESSSEEDFEMKLPKGPRIYVMQVSETEKKRLETEREEKERLEQEKKRLEEEREKEKARLEEELEYEQRYLELMPDDLGDWYKSTTRWIMHTKDQFRELRLARRYEMNLSVKGQEYPSDKMKRYLAIWHEKRGTVGAFTTGEEILTWEERAERRKNAPPSPPKPPPKKKPIVFGSKEMIEWAARMKTVGLAHKCDGCSECSKANSDATSQVNDTSEKEKEAVVDSSSSASSANANGEATSQINNTSEKEKEAVDSGASASSSNINGAATSQINNISEKGKEKENFDNSSVASPSNSYRHATSEINNIFEQEKEKAPVDTSASASFSSGFGHINGHEHATNHVNNVSEKEKEVRGNVDSTAFYNSNGHGHAASHPNNAIETEKEVIDKEVVAESSNMQSFFDRARAKVPATNVAQEAQTPAFNAAQQAQLEAMRQQALKHQPKIPSSLGMSPLQQSPLQPNPLQPSPLQNTSSQPNPLQTNALQEIQTNQLQRQSNSAPVWGGLMKLHPDGFTRDGDDHVDVDAMLEDDPNEPVFVLLDRVRNVPPNPVYFT